MCWNTERASSRNEEMVVTVTSVVCRQHVMFDYWMWCQRGSRRVAQRILESEVQSNSERQSVEVLSPRVLILFL